MKINAPKDASNVKWRIYKLNQNNNVVTHQFIYLALTSLLAALRVF